MQDAIEKKIEKFSNQNVNVQKRVNTSSKFRNNTHMMLGSLNKSQISSKHGPGTSGGQGQSSGGLGPISKKKFMQNTDLQNFQNLNEQEQATLYQESMGSSQINQQIGSMGQPLNVKYQLMKNANGATNNLQNNRNTQM